MHAQRRRLIDRLLILLVTLGGAVGCGQMDGCGGETTYPESGLTVDRAVQLRVTQQGFDSVESAIVPLLASQLGADAAGDQLSICLPAQDGDFKVCYRPTVDICLDGTTGCQVDVGIQSVEIVPVDNGPGTGAALDADQISVVVTVDAFDEDISFQGNLLGFDIDCVVRAYLADATDTMGVDVSLDLIINPTTGLLELDLDDITLDTDDLSLDGGGDFLCGALDAGFIQDALKGLIGTAIEPQVRNALNGFICQQCTEDAECEVAGSYCDVEDGVCRPGDDEDVCIRSNFGVEGSFPLADTLGDFAPTVEGDLSYLVYTATDADAPGDDSLFLGVRGGFTSEHNPCVDYRDPPSDGAMDRVNEVLVDAAPNGTSFDVVIGLSKRLLDHALWSAYNVGALCIEVVGGDSIPISTSLLSLFIPSINKLTGNQDRPVMIRLFPREVPEVEFGAGVIEQDPETGEYTLVEPQIILVLDDLDLSFYAYVFDRYTRFLTLNVDLTVPLGVTFTPNNEIQVLIGEDDLIQDVRVRDNGMLAESEEELEQLLPTLLPTILPIALEAIAAPIALPDLMGLQLELVQATSIGVGTMLGLYANISYVPPAQLRATVETQAALRGVEHPIRAHLDAGGALAPGVLGEVGVEALSPIVSIDLGAIAPRLDAPVEYSHRVDGGLWSIFTPRGQTLVLREPGLLVEGDHLVEVRARVAGDPYSLDPVAAQVPVRIDWRPPTIHALEVDAQAVQVDATDALDGPEGLSYRYRVDGGAWSAWQADDRLELTAHQGHRVRLEVEAQDLAGNVASRQRGVTIHAPAPVAPAGGPPMSSPAVDPGAQGMCSAAPLAASGDMGGAAPWLLLGLGGLLMLGRRRRLAAAASATLITLAASGLGGCGDEAASEADDCLDAGTCECIDDSDCAEEGAVCDEGVCESPVVPDDCASDDACPQGQRCIDADGDGGLECAYPPCADSGACDSSLCEGDDLAACVEGLCMCKAPCDGSCPDGQFCCNSQDTCLDPPDACEGMTCDPGFIPSISSEGTPNAQTCEVDGASCECVALPPLPIGDFGFYASIDVAQVNGAPLTAASVFNRRYGDLMVGVADDAGVIDWRFIDGVPADAEVEGQIDGPRGGIAEGGPRMGQHTSITVAADGALHVSYQDVDARALRYAHGVPDGSGGHDWSFITLDDSGDTGYWTHVTLDPSGAPGITYTTAEVDDGSGALVSEVRFIQATSAAPASADDWTSTLIARASRQGPCGEVCADGQGCRVSSGACEAVAADGICVNGCDRGWACFSDGAGGGVCDVQATVTPDRADIPYTVGVHAQHTRRDDGSLVVVYHDGLLGQLKIARQQADGAFAVEALVGDGASQTGLWPHVALDDAGGEHVAYVDWTYKQLYYMDVSAMMEELADDGHRHDGASLIGRHIVGADVSLWIGADGLPRLAYQDASAHDILIAARGADGVWTRETVAGDAEGLNFTGAYGFYLDHARVDGRDLLLNMSVNQQVSPALIAPTLEVHEAP